MRKEVLKCVTFRKLYTKKPQITAARNYIDKRYHPLHWRVMYQDRYLILLMFKTILLFRKLL